MTAPLRAIRRVETGFGTEPVYTYQCLLFDPNGGYLNRFPL
jgi:hypothetical protein